jgi:FtsH-binding integral membrane protein
VDQRTYGYGVAARPDEISESRDRFLVRTYNHLFGAIALFALVEVGLFTSGLAAPIANAMFGLPWMLILGAFMVAGWLGSRAAHTAETKAAQYAGLIGYTVAEAILFVPLLYIANHFAPGTISSAAAVTLVGFAGLTGIVFWTRKDFSFLGAFLRWAGIGALLLIGAGLIFGFQLGTFFSVGMVVLAGASILYDTSNILYRFPEDRYVGAALELFASVALMFWYVLRLFIGSRR